MLALFSAPTAPPRVPARRRESLRSPGNQALWDLHLILVDPASPPREARSAGREMLRILAEKRGDQAPATASAAADSRASAVSSREEDPRQWPSPVSAALRDVPLPLDPVPAIMNPAPIHP